MHVVAQTQVQGKTWPDTPLILEEGRKLRRIRRYLDPRLPLPRKSLHVPVARDWQGRAGQAAAEALQAVEAVNSGEVDGGGEGHAVPQQIDAGLDVVPAMAEGERVGEFGAADGDLPRSGGIPSNVQYRLAALEEDEYDALLTTVGERLATLNVGFADPEGLRLHSARSRRVVNTAVESEAEADPQEQRKLFVQQALERAFALNNRELRDYLVETLASGHSVRTGSLPVRDARDLLRAAHAIEAGISADGGYRFRIEPTGQRIATDYYEATDEFVIELVEESP